MRWPSSPSDADMVSALTRSIVHFETTFNEVLSRQSSRLRTLLGGLIFCGLICLVLLALSLSLIESRGRLRRDMQTVTEELRLEIEVNRITLEELETQLEKVGK